MENLTPNQKETILKFIGDYNETNLRATGRTTRIVDNTIQEMFNNPNEWVFVCDHYPTRLATVRVVDLIRRRLQYEHKLEIDARATEYGYEVKLKNYKKHSEDIANRKLQILDEMLETIKEQQILDKILEILNSQSNS